MQALRLPLITVLIVTLGICCADDPKDKPYCAVVMKSDDTFAEYWFPDKDELYIFLGQMPKAGHVGLYNPAEDYLIFKKTGGRHINKIYLNNAPPFAYLPSGKVVMAYDFSKQRMDLLELPFDY